MLSTNATRAEVVERALYYVGLADDQIRQNKHEKGAGYTQLAAVCAELAKALPEDVEPEALPVNELERRGEQV